MINKIVDAASERTVGTRDKASVIPCLWSTEEKATPSMQKKSRRLWWVLGSIGVLALVAGWSYYINSDRPAVVFYSSSSKHSQQFDAAGIHQVVLRVSSGDIHVERVPGQLIEMEGIVTYSIQGYHPSGPWSEPEPLSDAQKQFSSSITDGVLRLLSPEWQHIHHTVSYDDLVVRLPFDLPIEIVPYSQDELTDPDRRSSQKDTMSSS